MLLSEEEAKKKQCRVPVSVVVGVGGYIHDFRTVFTNCIASDCMMWRWSRNENGDIMMKETSEKWTCEHCGGKGKDPKFIYKNPEQPECDNLDGYCYECDGQGSGFKYAQVGFCGLGGKI